MPDPEPASNTRPPQTVADGVVQVAIVGRITGPAMAGFCAELERALAGPGDFTVVFDRRRMSAPTPDGREALERMAEELMPRLAERCLAWADVFDERRAESLRRAAERTAETETGTGQNDAPDDSRSAGLPYPHKVFDDHPEAVRWATGWTAGGMPARQPLG